ncbi:hypothetical protein [Tepidibacillus sp. HK-1]|uniref:hypothetical protein n=1 Tax=Tepidibacillus sp. HK-1 TaxID=1883407 RepID=UPI000852964F|nr:hypothetical protein [Tepidibacillus sp. HK-1]
MALKLIGDWQEKFSLLVSNPEATIKLFTEEEITKLHEHGLTNTQINIMSSKAVKTLLDLFETEIMKDSERKIVIESFLKNKCAPIQDRHTIVLTGIVQYYLYPNI